MLAPLRIKGLTLRNRIMSTSHASTLDDAGMPGERYQAYHEAKARGGLALTMFGGSSMVAADSSWGGGQIDVSNDAVIPHFQAFSQRIHAAGAALMCQISHLGRRADAMSLNWLPAIGPSRLRETRHRAFPREMDRADIERIVKAFGDAALRCREGGLDGLETMTGGHLIGQFLSPATNRRTDGFGGTLENRARFGLMVHEEIRRRVGDDFPLGIRLVLDELTGEGLSFEDGLAIARLFEVEGAVDFFNCIFGRMDTELTLAEYSMPGMSQPSAPFLDKAGLFKRETRLPVFHAGRIADIATARHAIKEGILDMVGMTRAHIADPEIVNKLARGAEERIRPCVGANHCLHKKVHCIHNPASGRELQLPHVIASATVTGRRVVVVGGGPGGLEAARVAAERGHDVTLFEVGGRLGGQLLIASRAALRRDLIGIVEWRSQELMRLGVDIRFNSYADGETVLAESPEVVIVATGGLPDTEWLDGDEHCLTVWDALSRSAESQGDDVIVYDGTGRHEAVSCALELAEAGRSVTFATIDDTIAVEMSYADRVIYRKRFAEHRIAVLADSALIRVRCDENGQRLATFRHELTGEQRELVAAEVVIEHGTYPFCEVYDQLRDDSVNHGITDIDRLLAGRPQRDRRPEGREFELYRIGDAVSSRSVHAAIYDALRLCMTL